MSPGGNVAVRGLTHPRRPRAAAQREPRACTAPVVVTVGVVIAWLLLTGVAVAQPALPTQSLAWDYPDDDVVAFAVDRFEAAYDGGAYVDAGLASLGPDSWSVPLPPLITGPHTVTVRACNAIGCSADSTPPFAFDMVADVPPVVDGGTVRIVGTP